MTSYLLTDLCTSLVATVIIETPEVRNRDFATVGHSNEDDEGRVELPGTM